MPVFQREPQTEALLSCPHDGQGMEQTTISGVTIDRCVSCGGTWFDKKELRRVAGDRELEVLATRIPINGIDSPFRCPRCGGRCVEGHIEEVEIDHCLDCNGVWLDRGELAEAQRLLKTERLMAAAGSGFRGFLARL